MKKAEEDHCFCLGDGDGFMICCDLCQVWYHGRCVGVNAEVSNNVDQWFCKTCSETRHFQKQEEIYSKISQIETSIDQLKATVDFSSISESRRSHLDHQNIEQQEKEEFISRIRCLEKQIFELEMTSKKTTKAYEDTLKQKRQMEELLENLTQEQEALSSQLILLREENSKRTVDVENMIKEKEAISIQLISAKQEQENLMKEKEAISIQLAALNEVENSELKELKAENAILKDKVQRFHCRSRLSLGNKKQ